MGLRVNNNISSLSALTNLKRNDQMQQASLERLSTGLRINRASDDPSGLVISEKLRAQIGSLNRALENTQNDINIINTAEAALQEISDVLVNMRSSVVFALNTGFASGEQIAAEQDKLNQSLVAIDRIAQSTRFGKRGLLNGDSAFLVEKPQAGAFDELDVRSVRLAPGAEVQKFDVNIAQMAERATIVTNQAFDSAQTLTEVRPGGNAADFVTLRVRGSKGSEDLLMGAGSTVGDLIAAINQNSSATGVYAAGYRPMALDSGSAEFVLKGKGSGIQLNGNGQDMVFNLQVGSAPAQNIVINSGADSIISEAELQAALTAVDPNFEVYNRDGDLVIRNAASNFKFSGAHNVRTFTLSADQIASMFAANEGGSATATFGDGTAIGFDVDGDGTITAGDEELSFANTGGLGVDNPADIAAMVAAVRGMAAFGGNAAVQTDANGNLIVIDMTGSTLGAAGSAVGIANQGGDDDVTQAALNGSRDVTRYTGDLGKLGITGETGASKDEAVSFINFAVPKGFVTDSGSLAIPPSVVSGGTLDFEIRDSSGVSTISVAAGPSGFITLSDIQTALNAASNDTVGQDDLRTRYQAYFDPKGGLSIVDRFGGTFTINEDSVGSDTDMHAVFGRADSASTSNFERLALFSTEFGADQIISLEDVTAKTSGVGLKSALQGGLAATGDGRSGLGALAGTTNTVTGVAGSRIQAVGSDVKGNISGMAFQGRGWDVNFVTGPLDVRFSLAQSLGAAGSAGMRNDAARFGFAQNASISGASALTPQYAQTRLPNGYLDSVSFAVRQSYSGGPQDISGMRFQLRETNSAVDSLMVGIRQISTGTLGARITPESPEAGGYPGGALNTLRTGAGNDLSTNAANALEIVDRAIDQVTSLRSYLGSVSSDTLQRNLNSVGVAVENLSGAQSFIRDLDFAAETSAFTKAQILFQASTSVLSAANSIPQAVLSLLQGVR